MALPPPANDRDQSVERFAWRMHRATIRWSIESELMYEKACVLEMEPIMSGVRLASAAAAASAAGCVAAARAAQVVAETCLGRLMAPPAQTTLTARRGTGMLSLSSAPPRPPASRLRRHRPAAAPAAAPRPRDKTLCQGPGCAGNARPNKAVCPASAYGQTHVPHTLCRDCKWTERREPISQMLAEWARWHRCDIVDMRRNGTTPIRIRAAVDQHHKGSRVFAHVVDHPKLQAALAAWTDANGITLLPNGATIRAPSVLDTFIDTQPKFICRCDAYDGDLSAVETICATCTGLPLMTARPIESGELSHDHRRKNEGRCYAECLGSLCESGECPDPMRCECEESAAPCPCTRPDPLTGPGGGYPVVPCLTCDLVYHPTCHRPPITAIQIRGGFQCSMCRAERRKLLAMAELSDD